MSETNGKDSEVIRRPVFVSTEQIQTRLPELLLRLKDGETVVIKHLGKTIGYLTPPNEEKERELLELAEAEVERFKEYKRNMPKTGMTTEDVLELVRHPVD